MTDDRSRWIALYALCASALMVVLDATIVNVAPPSIQSDLGFSQTIVLAVILLERVTPPSRAEKVTDPEPAISEAA